MNKFLLVVGLFGCIVVHGGTSNYTVDGVWYGLVGKYDLLFWDRFGYGMT